MKTYAIIMAAGLGTRMKSELPKCAYPLLNKPMIEYIVDTLEESKVDNIVTIVGHKKEVIENILKERSTYAFQEKQIGTANAVMCAKDLVKGKGQTIILPGDTPLIDLDIIDKLIDTHSESNNDLTIGTIDLEDPSGYGRIIRANNKIVKITEHKDATDDELKIREINTGVFCIDNELLFESLKGVKNNNAKGEYYLTDIVEIISSLNKKIGSFTITDTYKLTGINDLYTLSKVEKSLRKAVNKSHMLNGVNIINPESVTISPETIIEAGATIQQGCILLGDNVIGKGAVIGPNTELCNAVIEEGVVCRHSLVYDSTIKKNATIGPFAHIRMGSIIGERDRIGNFVEVKNSKIGTKTNAAHLAYIGDTDCGDNVNFGCGSITVNYDGKNKHRTTIGSRVFLGCNSNLIAPIEIEDDSYIAAGSTIHEKVEAGDMAIARTKQTNKKDYAKKYKK